MCIRDSPRLLAGFERLTSKRREGNGGNCYKGEGKWAKRRERGRKGTERRKRKGKGGKERRCAVGIFNYLGSEQYRNLSQCIGQIRVLGMFSRTKATHNRVLAIKRWTAVRHFPARADLFMACCNIYEFHGSKFRKLCISNPVTAAKLHTIVTLNLWQYVFVD